MKVNIELKKAIFNWLFNNQNTFGIDGDCVQEFSEYIYSVNTGDYLIGGEDVYLCILDAVKLLFEK